MAKYKVKDPQGQEHIIEGPEGATPDQVIAQAQALIPSGMPQQSSPSQPESPGILDTMSNAADRITNTIPAAASLMSPTLGMAQYAGQQMNEAAGQLGGAVTELAAEGRMVPNWVPGVGGKRIPPAPPSVAVPLGVATSIFANPQTYVNPGAGISGRIMRPTVPIERQAAVSAAERIGMPMRRGEMTGGKVSTGLSNLMEKTVLGSGPEDAFTARQYGALGAEKTRLQGKIGNTADTYAVGQTAQRHQLSREAAMSSKRQTMFDAIPTETNLPLNKYKEIGDTIVQEQSKIRPIARDAEVSKFAQDAQAQYGSTGEGVTGGPSKFGETISASPEAKFGPKSNYFDVKALRETLNGKIQEAHKAGNFTKERQFLRLKDALDQDINNFANAEASPLDSMMAKEFKQTYRKANAFSGAFKGLFKSDEAQALINAPPEKVVDIVFKKNNETAIKQFRALTGEEGFLPAKQKFTQEILDSPNVQKELSKYEDGTLRSIYNAQELQELTDYGLAQSVPKTTGNLQGTQGSARSNIQAGQYTGLGSALLALFTGHPLIAAAGVGQFVAPAAISRINLHWASGIPASVGKVTQNIGKFGVLANQNSERRNRLSQYIDRVIENRR